MKDQLQINPTRDQLLSNGHVQFITRDYLRVFGILLCIIQAQFISYFQEYESLKDQGLPFLVRPTNFPVSTTSDFLAAFLQKQWGFCVESLKYGMSVHLEKRP